MSETPSAEALNRREAMDRARRIASVTIGKVAPDVYHELVSDIAAAIDAAQGETYCAPIEFFVDVDSLLSWIAHRGWRVESGEDKATTIRLSNEARKIYERR